MDVDIEKSALKISNPAPLGLLGFGMSTVLLSLHNAGYIPLDAVILSMGIFCGGLAQFAAGMMEYRNGNTFGTTAFTLYGVFWMALCFIKIDPAGFGSEGATMGSFCLVWGVLTLFLFIGTLKGRNSSKFVFSSLTVVFFLLSAGDFLGSETVINLAGYVGVICGASAMYTAFAEVLSEQLEKEVLPF